MVFSVVAVGDSVVKPRNEPCCTEPTTGRRACASLGWWWVVERVDDW